ncbi:MAG: RnfABCDGE type electron transport complex subunit D [Candidatus Krumholzibacteriales bacterium]
MEEERKDKKERSETGTGSGKGKTAAGGKKKKPDPESRFLVSSSPHLHQGENVGDIMKLVVYALLPAAIFSIYVFGLSALRVIIIAVCSSILFELIAQRIMKRPVTVKDGSAMLTGLLLAFNLPSTSPWWLIVTGSFFAIVIAKQLYGGLGYNLFNPALVGRAVLFMSFPVQMTARWVAPRAADAVTTATPLGELKEGLQNAGYINIDTGSEKLVDYLLGLQPGCLGEVSAILLLAGGIFLIIKKVISWHIPVAFIGSVWIMTGIFHLIDPAQYAGPTFHILTGGVFLGAIFMATDYVTSPVTRSGMLIFGVGCGLITVLIRLFGSYPEGVSFSILIMNAVTPLIDRFTTPKVFGAVEAAE